MLFYYCFYLTIAFISIIIIYYFYFNYINYVLLATFTFSIHTKKQQDMSPRIFATNSLFQITIAMMIIYITAVISIAYYCSYHYCYCMLMLLQFSQQLIYGKKWDLSQK